MFTGEEDTTSEGAGTESETSESDTQDTNTDDSKDGQDNSSKESDKSGNETAQKDDEEPPTRKPRTNADWVALRRGRKLDKERSKHDEEQGEAEDEDEDVSPEDAKIIEKVVAKKLQPFEEEREAQTIRSEINEFVAQNPDFKEFVAKAEKWARHPSWKNVPTEQLMYAVAGKQLLTIGAKRREEANRKARETQVGGNSTQGTGAKKAVWDMTEDEFKKELDRVKTGGTN